MDDGRSFNDYGAAELRRLLCRPQLPQRSLNCVVREAETK